MGRDGGYPGSKPEARADIGDASRATRFECRGAARRALERRALRARTDRSIVLDRRKRIVEVVQKPLPILILRRLTEANGMVFERLPIDEQDVAVRHLDTALQLVRYEAGHRSDDRRRLFERRFERSLAPGANVQHCDLENHLTSPVCRSAEPTFHGMACR